jgi:AraC-like DNA-binding protein
MSRVFPDLMDVTGEAEQYVAHSEFDRAMLSFCRGLADFHSVAVARRAGVVDTVTWAVALLVLYLGEHEPERANASQLITICAEGPLAGATAVRNAIALLRQGGMIICDEPLAVGLAHRLRPAPALIEAMQDNLFIRFSALEPIIAWPRPAAEWARTDGVLSNFVRGNVEAYRRSRHILFEPFPEIRLFMDRHCGYHILMEIFGCLKISTLGASGRVSLSDISDKFAVSRTHVRKLLTAATDQNWLRYELGGHVTIAPHSLARYRLWFGHEFAWIRRVAGKL